MSGEGHLTAALGQMTINVDTLVTMYIAMFFLLFVAFIASRKLTIVPNKIQMVAESIVTFFTNTVESMMGSKRESTQCLCHSGGRLPWHKIFHYHKKYPVPSSLCRLPVHPVPPTVDLWSHDRWFPSVSDPSSAKPGYRGKIWMMNSPYNNLPRHAQ